MTTNGKKQLIWHIGDPKTGSTSIQRAFATQSVDAGDRIIDCFRPKGTHTNSVAPSRALKSKNNKAIAKWFRKIKAWADESPADYLVVSAETFANSRPRLMKRAIQTYLEDYAETAQIISYVRPHASRFLAAYTQRTKMGMPYESYDDLIVGIKRQKALFYAPRASKWRNVFGGNYTLRPFMRSELRENDVVQDFFYEILGDDNFTIKSKIEANTSLSTRALVGVKFFHQYLREADAVQVTRKRLAKCLDHYHLPRLKTSRTPPILDKQTVEVLYDTYIEDAQTVDKIFFDSPLMVSALEKARAEAPAESIDFSLNAHFTADEQDQLSSLFKDIVKLQAGHVELWVNYLNFIKKLIPLTKRELSMLEKNKECVDEMDRLLTEVAVIFQG